MIVKVKGGFRVVSKTTGKNLGTFTTRAAAEKREKQISFFRNAGKSRGGPGSLRAKVRKKSILA